MKTLSYIFAFMIWLAFIYQAIVAIMYFIPFFLSFSTENVGMKAVVLTVYVIMLEVLAIVYKKLPHKPSGLVFRWLEKVSFFK